MNQFASSSAVARLEPLRALTHPVWIAALALLILNDHLLKHSALAGWTTGKLSDVAGLIVAPALLAAICRVRTRAGLYACAAAVAAVFSAINLSAAWAGRWDALISTLFIASRTTVDPTDLIALPMVLAGIRILRPVMETPLNWSFPRQAVQTRAIQTAMLILAITACAATSRVAPPDATGPHDAPRQIDPRSYLSSSAPVTPAISLHLSRTDMKFAASCASTPTCISPPTTPTRSTPSTRSTSSR